MKKKKENIKSFKVTDKELSEITAAADKHFEGNMSLLVRTAIKEYLGNKK